MLVIVDHWVAKEMGAAALAQLKAGDYTVRVARDHVSADVRSASLVLIPSCPHKSPRACRVCACAGGKCQAP